MRLGVGLGPGWAAGVRWLRGPARELLAGVLASSLRREPQRRRELVVGLAGGLVPGWAQDRAVAQTDPPKRWLAR